MNVNRQRQQWRDIWLTVVFITLALWGLTVFNIFFSPNGQEARFVVDYCKCGWTTGTVAIQFTISKNGIKRYPKTKVVTFLRDGGWIIDKDVMAGAVDYIQTIESGKVTGWKYYAKTVECDYCHGQHELNEKTRIKVEK